MRKGKGGIFFWTESAEKTYRTLRDRIVAEAVASIMLGQEVRSRLRDALGNEFFWDGNEIHADVGKNGPTKDIVDSIAAGVRSACTYAGARNLEEFYDKAVIGIQTAAGYTEGKPVSESW